MKMSFAYYGEQTEKRDSAIVPILSASSLTQHAFSFSEARDEKSSRVSTLVAVSRVEQAPGVFDSRKAETSERWLWWCVVIEVAAREVVDRKGTRADVALRST